MTYIAPLSLATCRDAVVPTRHITTPGIILGGGSANERRRYIVTPPLIGRARTENVPCNPTHASKFGFWWLETSWAKHNYVFWSAETQQYQLISLETWAKRCTFCSTLWDARTSAINDCLLHITQPNFKDLTCRNLVSRSRRTCFDESCIIENRASYHKSPLFLLSISPDQGSEH